MVLHDIGTRDAVAMLFVTEDRQEGVAAFLAKRQPTVTGR